MPASRAPSTREPWILICGGFHARGGMDRANLALAERLQQTGHQVYLVGHDIDESIALRKGISAIRVPRPIGSIALGESRLAKRGLQIAEQVKRDHANVVVVGNGGNSLSCDVNWVHYVHHASRFDDAGFPFVLKLKNRYAERLFRRREKAAINTAKLVVTNSETTRRNVIDLIGVETDRVRTIYLGSNTDWSLPSAEERRSGRAWLNIGMDAPIVAFVGALGHDNRKGFDTLWRAWMALSADANWKAHLVVAGGGRQVEKWRQLAAETNKRVHFLGFTERVRDVLAASDLLVSPVRYEPFGLNVTEAICRGVPAIVSAAAGVAELYPQELRSWLLADPTDHEELANKMTTWSADLEVARAQFAGFGDQLRRRSWVSMADEFIALVHERLHTSAGNTLVATQ